MAEKRGTGGSVCPDEADSRPGAAIRRADGVGLGERRGGLPVRSRACLDGSSEADDSRQQLAHRKDLPSLRAAGIGQGGRGRRRKKDGRAGQQGAEQRPAAAASGKRGSETTTRGPDGGQHEEHRSRGRQTDNGQAAGAAACWSTEDARSNGRRQRQNRVSGVCVERWTAERQQKFLSKTWMAAASVGAATAVSPHGVKTWGRLRIGEA